MSLVCGSLCSTSLSNFDYLFGRIRDKDVSGSFRGSSESRAHRHGLLVPFVQRLRCVLVAFCRMFCRLSGGICVKSRVIHVKGAAVDQLSMKTARLEHRSSEGLWKPEEAVGG